MWRKLNKELNPKNLLPAVKYRGEGVVVGECFVASGFGNLPFNENNTYQYNYIIILKEHFKIYYQKFGIKNAFNLYQLIILNVQP